MDNTKDLAKLVAGYIKGDKKTKAYDTAATVKRIENGTAYVQIPGGVPETPVKLTIDAKAGDTVQVRVANGSAWMVGNASAPPTDDAEALVAKAVATTADTKATTALSDATRAKEAADTAEAYAQQAKVTTDEINAYAQTAGKTVTQILNDGETAGTAAAEAKASAENASEYASRALGNLSTLQSIAETLTWIAQHGTMALTSDQQLDPTHVYFIQDNAGDYTVGGVKYAIVPEPDAADLSTYYELTIDESLNNYVGTHLALDGEGLWLLPAATGTNKVLIATGAGSTYTTAGTYLIGPTGGIIGKFTADAVQIGQNASGKTRTELTTSGMQIIKKDNSQTPAQDVQIANLGFGQCLNSQGQTVNAPFYTFGERQANSAVGYYSTAEGLWGTVSGPQAHGEGYEPTATGEVSHAEGYISEASAQAAHAEGYQTNASGKGAHTEGDTTSATANGAHAEGYSTLADAAYAHAEGNDTEAGGSTSHAEGYQTHAGAYAHAEGSSTDAGGNWSHAQNLGTKARSRGQTAIGEYNVADATGTSTTRGTHAFIVGNGTADNARSNALTVGWNGNLNAAGDISADAGLTAGTDIVSGAGITAGGDIWSDGKIEADGEMNCNGNMSTGGLLTADGDIESLNGGIIATAGDIGALTAGTVTTTGDITAGGDVKDGNSDTIASVKTTATNAGNTASQALGIANTAATNLATLGTIKDSGEKDCGSIASSTSWNTLGGNVKVALTAGTWILIGWVNFATKADTTYAGTRRAIRLYKVTATAGVVTDSNVIVGPSDANTNIQVVYPVHITSDTTYRVEALQNAPGSTALATKARLFAVKVGL